MKLVKWYFRQALEVQKRLKNPILNPKKILEELKSHHYKKIKQFEVAYYADY